MKTEEFGAWTAFQSVMRTVWGWCVTGWAWTRTSGRFLKRVFWPDADKISGHWLAKMVTFGCLGAVLAGLTTWWLALIILLVFVGIVHGSPYLAEDKEDKNEAYITALRQLKSVDLQVLVDSKQKLMSQMVGTLYPSVIADEIRLIQDVIREKQEGQPRIDTREAIEASIRDRTEGE